MRIALLVSVIIIFSQEVLVANTDIKQAFVAGIKASIEVLEYEEKQLSAPVKENYCLSISLENRLLHSWEVIKLESLGLLLKYRPSFFIQEDTDGSFSGLLCLSTRSSKNEVQKDINNILKIYPKLSKYTINTLFLSDISHVYRAIPAIKMKKQSAIQQDKNREHIITEITIKPIEINTTIRMHSNKQAIGMDVEVEAKKEENQDNLYKSYNEIVDYNKGIMILKTKFKNVYTIRHLSGDTINTDTIDSRIVHDHNDTIVSRTELKNVYVIARSAKIERK